MITQSPTCGRTASTLQRTTGLPLKSRRSFWRPIRRANPAASTTAAIMMVAKRGGGGRRGTPAFHRPGSGRGLFRRRLDGPARENAAEMRLVLDRTLEVGLHVHAVGRFLRCRLDGGGVEALADEPGLHALGADGLGAGPGDTDAGLGARSLLVDG